MYARKWGKSLILGRKELDPDGQIADDDRVKITRERARHYVIRVKDWKGRYHHTGIEEDLGAVLKHLRTTFLHCVQATPYNKQAEDRDRTSGKRNPAHHQLGRATRHDLLHIRYENSTRRWCMNPPVTDQPRAPLVSGSDCHRLGPPASRHWVEDNARDARLGSPPVLAGGFPRSSCSGRRRSRLWLAGCARRREDLQVASLQPASGRGPRDAKARGDRGVSRVANELDQPVVVRRVRGGIAQSCRLLADLEVGGAVLTSGVSDTRTESLECRSVQHAAPPRLETRRQVRGPLHPLKLQSWGACLERGHDYVCLRRASTE